MAVDVLTYNALAEINQGLRDKIQALDASITEVQSGGSGGGGGANEANIKLVKYSGARNPLLWCLIPKDPASGSWTTGFKVCDQSGYLRCGCNCSWTVPSGVTCARFQLWGAGASSGNSCCCGYGIPGSSGAYASVIIPVSSGQTYTICSGCAQCCHPCWGGGNTVGNPSYVQGTGLTNFCAQGGRSNICCTIKAHNNQGGTGKGLGQYSNWLYYMGMCAQYNGNDMCLQSSIPQSAYSWPRGSQNRYHWPQIDEEEVTYYGTASQGEIYGHNGLYGQFMTGGGFRACALHAPTYGFLGCNDTCQNNTSYEACCYNRGGCCSMASQGCNQVPSRGGSYNMKCGGHTGYPQGDFGRMGMVCICYG